MKYSRVIELYDFNEEKWVGKLIEHEDHVEVDLPKEHMFNPRQDHPYSTLAFDSTRREILPGDTDYIDQVALDFSRTFATREITPSEETPNGVL